MTAPPPARTLDFGASATASLLVKMTITYGMSERRDQMITYSLFEKLMRNEMPRDQGDLDAILMIEDKKENLINNLASSWIYEKLVTNGRLSDKITDTKIEYSHLYSTSSLLPHWDTIHATGSTLIASPLRSQQPARFSAASSSSSSNVLVTNYKPPRLTDKQSDTQVYLTLVALEHASARLDFGQMTSITSEHTDLSVHWNSTVLRSQLTRTPEIDTILQFLASIKTTFMTQVTNTPNIERQLRKIKHKPGELPRDYLIRFQRKLIELEDAAVISGTQSNYHIISSVTEQVKQSTKGMNSEFKQQLKVQMHARQVVGFDSWAQYLTFVTSVQRAVNSDTDASSDDENKKVISKKAVRSLVTTTGGRKTPKDLFPDSPLTSTSEWPEERDRCVFDYNKVRCPYGGKCTRIHINTSKPSPSVAASNGSNSPKIRALDVAMRKLSAQKDQLLAAEDDGVSISSNESDDSFDPHKMPPLPPTSRGGSRGSASSSVSTDDLASLKRLLGLDN